MQKQTAYVRPMAFTDRLAMIAANEEKEKRKKAVVNYMREFNKSTPPPDELTTEQLERLIANRQQALRLQVVARREREQAVARYMVEFNKTEPPPGEFTTEQLERMVANHQQARRLQDSARRGKAIATATATTDGPSTLHINDFKVLIPGGIMLYPSQELVLKRILECVDAPSPGTALIESATGTGKSIAMLASVCAWLIKYNDHRKEKRQACQEHRVDDEGNLTCQCPRPTRVFYCTKTFAQLAQVVEEYSRFPYYKDGTLRHTVLAGREKLCVNKAVLSSCGSNSSAITTKCHNKLQTKGGGCRAYTELNKRFGAKPADLRQAVRSQLKPEKAFDIEDLHQVLGGLDGGPVCPYFAATDLLYAKADIVFCVYPYVFDPAVRRVKNIDLRNAVIVVDEGHNILDVGCEALTFEFEQFRLHELCTELYECVRNAQELVDAYKDEDELAGEMLADARSRYEGLGMIGKCVAHLYTWFHQRLQASWKTEKYACMGKPKMVYTLEPETFHSTLQAFFFEENDDCDDAEDADVDAKPRPIRDVSTAYEQFNSFVEGAAVFLTSDDNVKTRPHITSMDLLRRFFYFLYYYAQDPTQFRCTFEMKLDRCGIMDESVFAHYAKSSHNCSVRFWPLTASACLKDIALDMRALVLASGTLSPVEMFESQFGIPFAIKELKLPSVVPAERIFVAALPSGPTGRAIDGRFESVRDPRSAFYEDVAGIIAGACRIVPDGIVCFFGSYTILENAAVVLRKKFAFFADYKLLFTETAGGDSKRILERFKAAIQEGRGALLFAVFRGSISEGVNLSHEMARSTIIVGIPFPNMSDEYVRIRSEALGGFEWSALHAFLAINQAIGRSLRNKYDWSSVLLLDFRFAEERYTRRLSAWAANGLKVVPDLRRLGPLLKNFCQSFGPLAAPLANVAPTAGGHVLGR